MIKTFFSVSILALSLQAFSQNSLKIKGKIIEETSGHPLPFATIGISGSPYGTVSNPDGEFVFFLPPNYKNDTLAISHVGFKTQQIPIAQARNSTLLEVKLEESVILLDEVLVNSEKHTAKQILEKALTQLGENYLEDQFISKGFFRDIRDQNGETVYLVEAAVDVQEPGFSAAGDRPKKFFLKSVRASESRINGLLAGSLLNLGNSLRVNMEYNFWLNGLKEFLKKDEFTIDQVVSNDGRWFYEITTERLASKPSLAEKYKEMQYRLKHRYLVDSETYAIHKVEHLEYPIDGEYVGIEHPYPGDSLYYSKKGWNQVIEFAEFKGKMFLKYHNINYAFDIVDEKNDRLYLDMKYQFTFIITDIAVGESERPSGYKMNRNKPLALQGKNYDDSFWNDPSNVKLVPLTKKQLSDLEKEKPLTKQFKSKKSKLKRNAG